MDNECNVTGVMIQYYMTCKTELWYFTHGINFSHEDDHLALGKIAHQEAYKRKEKEVGLGPIKIDVVGNEIIEMKLSEKSEIGGIWQLKYYLYFLKKWFNLDYTGKLYLIKERKTIPVILTPNDERIIENAILEIEKIRKLKTPPKPVRKKYCRKCAYYELCWS